MESCCNARNLRALPGSLASASTATVRAREGRAVAEGIGSWLRFDEGQSRKIIGTIGGIIVVTFRTQKGRPCSL